MTFGLLLWSMVARPRHRVNVALVLIDLLNDLTAAPGIPHLH